MICSLFQLEVEVAEENVHDEDLYVVVEEEEDGEDFYVVVEEEEDVCDQEVGEGLYVVEEEDGEDLCVSEDDVRDEEEVGGGDEAAWSLIFSYLEKYN